MLGEDEDWLWDVANEMDQEDGLIWVYGPGDDGVMAFTDFGIETLTGLIEITRPILICSSGGPPTLSDTLRSTPHANIVDCLQQFSGVSRFDCTVSNTSSAISQSGSVIPVSMSGLLMPVTQ